MYNETIASPSGYFASHYPNNTSHISAKRQALLFLLHSHMSNVSAKNRVVLNQHIAILQSTKPMQIFLQWLNAKVWRYSREMCAIYDKIINILQDSNCNGLIQTSIYDHRSNVILYVLRETQWALLMESRLSRYENLIISSTKKLLSQITTDQKFVIDSIKSCFLCFLEIKDDVEKFVFQTIKKNNIRNEFSSSDFADIKKQPISVIYRHIRSFWYFKKRGRVDLNDSELDFSNDSFVNKHAGIAATTVADLVPESKYYFPEEQLHGKNGYRREGKDGLDTFFLERSVPYISGASGTLTFFFVSYLLQGIVKKSDMEILTLTHISSLINGGHHSALEILLVAQSMGLFSQLPNIASSSKDINFYAKFVSQFSSYIGSNYGLPSIDAMRTTYV
jgi:hypothetical protein